MHLSGLLSNISCRSTFRVVAQHLRYFLHLEFGILMSHELHNMPKMGEITQLDTVFHAVLMNVSQNDYFKWHRMKVKLAAPRCSLSIPPYLSFMCRKNAYIIKLHKCYICNTEEQSPFICTHANSRTNPNMEATWLLEC